MKSRDVACISTCKSATKVPDRLQGMALRARDMHILTPIMINDGRWHMHDLFVCGKKSGVMAESFTERPRIRPRRPHPNLCLLLQLQCAHYSD